MDRQNNWQLLKRWFGDNAPVLLQGFNKSEHVDFSEIEKELDIQIPDEIRGIYNIHNGQKESTIRIFPFGILLSSQQILKEWRIFNQLVQGGVFDGAKSNPDDIGIKERDWFNLKWMPFCSNDCGDFLCIDFDPTDSGKVGQVISFWHDSPDRQLIATSFEIWFDETIKRIVSDEYSFDEQTGTFEKK